MAVEGVLMAVLYRADSAGPVAPHGAGEYAGTMRFFPVAALAWLAAAPAPAADTPWQTIRPAISTRLVRNPDCGLMVMPGLAKAETLPAWVLDTCSVAYFRLDWAQVVDERGEPQFDKLDREVFKGYRDRGLRLGFRIMAANPHSEREYVTPQVIIEREHLPTVRHTSVYGKPAVDPVFWDDRYVAAYGRLLAALGAYLDGKPWAGPVDLGGMGDWGEMHLERWTQAQLDATGFSHERYLKAVLAMMTRMNAVLPAERKAFCYAPILMPDPVPVFDALVAWATGRGWWLRNDGCTTAGPQPYLKPHLDRLWTRVGFVAEPNGSITDSGDGTVRIEDWFKAQLDWHASFINLMGIWDLKDLTPAQIEHCRDAARRAGYRLVVEEAVLPRTVGWERRWLAGRIRIGNRGVAPPYGSAAYLAVDLVRDGRVSLHTTLHPEPPLADLLPGTTASYDLLVEPQPGAGIGGGGHDEVRIAIVDPVHGPLALGNEGVAADGWLSLGYVDVAGPPDALPPFTIKGPGRPALPPGCLFDLAASDVSPAPGVTVTRGPSGPTLKGTNAAEWNYGYGIGNVKVAPHTVYVMRVRVQARNSAIADSQLYFKFGVNRKDGSWGGNIDTAKYDFARAGEPQILTAVYRPAAGDGSFGIAIEKGRTAPSSIDADILEWNVTAVPVP